MTTFHSATEKCALCGEESSQAILTSTNAFGSSDLDTRPPEMERSTIHMQVQMCPSCGYCTSDISKKISKASKVVQSNDYKQHLNDPSMSKLARAFICYSLIEESAEDYTSAGWACVRAAWVCDDEANDTASKKCREKAVVLFNKAKETGQKYGQDSQTEYALLTDLLRRSGQFEQALKACEAGLKTNPQELLLNILNFEKQLIAKSDIACHTVDEAFEDIENGQ